MNVIFLTFMERGLLWLPLLGVFCWLAWAGWNEYRKLEAYKVWATDFERAKYDIYAALGQRGEQLVWGRPTRQGPVNLQQVALPAVTEVLLYGGDRQPPHPETLPRGCSVSLGLTTQTGVIYLIPFTDFELASRWQAQLQTLLASQSASPSA